MIRRVAVVISFLFDGEREERFQAGIADLAVTHGRAVGFRGKEDPAWIPKDWRFERK